MRLGNKTLGHYRLAQPDAQTITSWQDYLDQLAVLVAAGYTRAQAMALLGSPRYPYSGGANTATAALYPVLSGRVADTVIRGGTAGTYQIALDGYGIIPYWRNGTWRQRICEPDVLAFDYPAGADFAEYLVRPNTLSLYDQLGELVQTFLLRNVVPDVERSSAGATMKIEAQSLLSQLADEFVVAQAFTGSGFSGAVRTLMVWQDPGRAFSVGEIWEATTFEGINLSFDGKSLLDCLTELWRYVGQRGMFTVTPAREFVWLERFGSSGPVEIKLGYNLRSLRRRCNNDEMATRLHVYGAGLSHDVRPTTYREANIATYGLIVKRVIVEEADSDTINEFADALIAVTSVPALEYEVSAADLYSIGLARPITLGCAATIEDTDLGITTQQDVIGITRRLDNPLDCTIEFARKRRDMRSVIESLSRRIAAQETRDHTENINAAVTAGHITGVPRLSYSAARLGDVTIGTRFGYHDGTRFQSMPRYDPAAGSEEEGDLLVNASGNLEHWDGAAWRENSPSAALVWLTYEGA